MRTSRKSRVTKIIHSTGYIKISDPNLDYHDQFAWSLEMRFQDFKISRISIPGDMTLTTPYVILIAGCSDCQYSFIK